MGKIHRVRKSSRKKSKYHDAEADVLGSFYFEDSPQKEEVVAGSRSSHGDSEFVESSSSSTAFCVSNHSNKGLFFSNSPIHVSKEASCEHSIENFDCYACDNGVVAGRIHVFGEERAPENNSTDSLIAPHEAVDSEIKRKEVVEEIDPALVFGVGSVRENDIEGSFSTRHATFEPGVNHEAYEDPAKIDGLVEDCSDSEAMAPVLEFPSSGIISPVATSPAPSSGSASRPPSSFPCLSSVFFDDPENPLGAPPPCIGNGIPLPSGRRSKHPAGDHPLPGKDSPANGFLVPASTASLLGKEVQVNLESQPVMDTVADSQDCLLADIAHSKRD